MSLPRLVAGDDRQAAAARQGPAALLPTGLAIRYRVIT
jgi:hypothetical protein